MKLLTLLYPALLALLTLSPSPSLAASQVPKDAILLSKVKTLTLRDNALTSHRRVPAVPQLSCKGPGCAHYKVDIMRCTNTGSSYGDEEIEWSCTASLPEEFKLGSTDVACEGYSSRDDPYVLKGSCGVEYRLLLTSKGEEKYGKGGWNGGNGEEGEWNWGSILFVLIFVAVFAWIAYAAWTAPQTPAAPPEPRRPGNFWGGGWGPGGGGGGPGGPGGDPYDPPPPYPGGKPSRYGRQQEAWRPGFWTGAGVGAGLGYMAGNRGREREPLFGQPQRGNNTRFGNGNNQGYQTPGRSDSNGSSSSARHESTGFGSTSRR